MYFSGGHAASEMNQVLRAPPSTSAQIKFCLKGDLLTWLEVTFTSWLSFFSCQRPSNSLLPQATWKCWGWLKRKILIYPAYKLLNRFDSALCEGVSFSLFWRNARRRPLHVEVGRPWQDGGEASPGVRLAPHTPAYFRPLMQFDVSLSQTDVLV